jgi:transposase
MTFTSADTGGNRQKPMRVYALDLSQTLTASLHRRACPCRAFTAGFWQASSVTHVRYGLIADPASRSLSVKVSGVGATFWRRGHAAMAAAEEAGRYWGQPAVYAHAPGRRNVARGEPVRDGWLRFKLSDADYRQLSNMPGLSAIVTVDRRAAQILRVKFLTVSP